MEPPRLSLHCPSFHDFAPGLDGRAFFIKGAIHDH